MWCTPLIVNFADDATWLSLPLWSSALLLHFSLESLAHQQKEHTKQVKEPMKQFKPEGVIRAACSTWSLALMLHHYKEHMKCSYYTMSCWCFKLSPTVHLVGACEPTEGADHCLSG